MDYSKIQMELIKEFYKDDKRAGNKYSFKVEEEQRRVAIIEGTYIAFIPSCLFFLDINKLSDKPPCTLDFSKFAPGEPLTLTNSLEKLGGFTCVILENANGEKFYIDERKYKIFANDKKSELRFSGSTTTAPIFVYDRDYLIGIVCPVKHC